MSRGNDAAPDRLLNGRGDAGRSRGPGGLEAAGGGERGDDAALLEAMRMVAGQIQLDPRNLSARSTGHRRSACQ